MRKIFTEPTKPEELYEFFTYGLALNPLDWTLHWHPNSMHNTIRRRSWYVRITWPSASIVVDYQAGYRESDKSWYMYQRKYLTNVHK